MVRNGQVYMSKYWDNMLKKYKKGLYFGDVRKYIEKDTEETLIDGTDEEKAIQEEKKYKSRQPVISDRERTYYTAKSQKVPIRKFKWQTVTLEDKRRLKQYSVTNTQAARHRLLRKRRNIKMTIVYTHASLVTDDNAILWYTFEDVWSFFLQPLTQLHYMIYIVDNHMHCCTTLHQVKTTHWELNRQYMPYRFNMNLVYEEIHQGMSMLLFHLYPTLPSYQVMLPEFESYLQNAFDYQRRYTTISDPEVYFYSYGMTPKERSCKKIAVPPCCKTICKCNERYKFICNIIQRDLLSLAHIEFDYHLFIK